MNRRTRYEQSRRAGPFRDGRWLAAVSLFVLAPAATAQVSVTARFDTSKWVAPRSAIELRIESGALPESARLAILAGAVDMSALFHVAGDTLRYQPNLFPLPPGEHELTIYVVSSNDGWSEVGRFPLRVLTPTGFQRAEFLPRLALNLKGQVAEGHSAGAEGPPRSEYQDVLVSAGLQSLQRRDGWSVKSQANLVGASNRQEALRFGELASDAPKLDLADYQIGVEATRAALTLGQSTFGEQRHLMSAFGSRGITGSARIGSGVRVSLAALNGSAIVGWSNPVGLSRSDHRIFGGTVAADVLPRRPGVMQLEATLMAGSLLPRADFNRGVVNDAERSDGTGVRLSLNDPGHRLQLDAGFARSRSDVPDDATLAQGLQLVGVTRTSRNARYLDATYQLVQRARITRRLAADLSISAKHERVDPLFRSVASVARSDLESDEVGISGALGTLVFRGNVAVMRDNLGHIPSVLTTRTHGRTGTVALPLASLGRSLRWLPVVSYDVALTNQAGDGAPPNSEFTPTHVPDQLSRNQHVSAEWQRSRWRAGYRLNLTSQDNRQVGRENSDFATSVHNISLGVAGTVVAATLDLGADGTQREESAEETSTRTAGATLDWHLTTTTVVSAAFATTVTDRGDTTVQRVNDGRLELGQRLPLLRLSARSTAGQLFVRFSRQDERLADALTAVVNRRRWYVSTGFTLGVF